MYPLNSDESNGGRCGPKFGNVRCNMKLESYAMYCNEYNGWCGITSEHKNSQSTDAYDYKPKSCNWQCPPLNQNLDNSGRCGPLFDSVRCNPNLESWAIYCNEGNGWCGNTDDHKNAQESDKFDYNPSKCIPL